MLNNKCKRFFLWQINKIMPQKNRFSTVIHIHNSINHHSHIHPSSCRCKHTADNRDSHITQTPFKLTERRLRGRREHRFMLWFSWQRELALLCMTAKETRSPMSFSTPREHVRLLVRRTDGIYEDKSSLTHRTEHLIAQTPFICYGKLPLTRACCIWPKSRTTDRL